MNMCHIFSIPNRFAEKRVQKGPPPTVFYRDDYIKIPMIITKVGLAGNNTNTEFAQYLPRLAVMNQVQRSKAVKVSA